MIPTAEPMTVLTKNLKNLLQVSGYATPEADMISLPQVEWVIMTCRR